MDNNQILRTFGQVVLDYFLINFPNTYSFKLSIDDYTFSELSMMARINEDFIIRAIQAKETFCSNNLEALAIAAYQVKIVGDVDSVISTGSDSYYQKIKDNYSSYKNSDNNSICNGYFCNQINLWRQVYNLFQEHGRNLEIPTDHPGTGRYVQYPVKSHELKNSDLLRWADTFIRRGLAPQDISITYKYFCSLFFPRSNNESYKRTIYNFYKIWDGRSYSDILYRRPRTNITRDSSIIDTQIVLDYLTAKVEFYNKENGSKITSFEELQLLFYSKTNTVFFVQNEEDDFYSPRKNKIDFGLDFIIVSKTELDIQDIYLENKFQQKYGNEIIYVYILEFSKEICVKLRIETAQKPPLDLVGGLKKARNCYYKFWLPTIEFTQPQHVMYINSNLIEIDSNRVVLSQLPCLEQVRKKGGSVAIRLSDYLPVNFSVEDIDSDKNQAEQLGWEIENTRFIPAFIRDKDESDKGNIIGFNSTIDFKPIKNTSVSVDTRRAFIIRNEYLENRFSKRKGL